MSDNFIIFEKKKNITVIVRDKMINSENEFPNVFSAEFFWAIPSFVNCPGAGMKAITFDA